jgi:ABC-2 type transport system ATP-binding protein
LTDARRVWKHRRTTEGDASVTYVSEEPVIPRSPKLRLALGAAALTLLAAPAAAGAQDLVVTSFDGTPIVTHAFANPALAPGAHAPTVLLGPGWSGPGESNPAGGGIAPLLAAGYNVVTFDPRGFGDSGGEATIDAPQVEGRDVSRIIDWVATQPWAQLDRPGDPRVGMAGGSYGAGIQYATASVDRRVDALAPIVGWHSLVTSLYKDQTFKQGWNTLLYGAGLANGNADGLKGGPAGVQTGGLDPHITSSYTSANATGRISAADQAWFAGRGPGDAGIAKIRAATLVIGGTVDTLFPLDEDIAIYKVLKRHHTPVKMMWFCGGHGKCLTGTGDPGVTGPTTFDLGSEHVAQAQLAWFTRYLKGDRRQSTGPGFEWLADDAKWRSAPAWPVKAGKPVIAVGRGALKLVKGYSSGEATAAGVAPAGQSLQVRVRVPRRTQLLGAPRLTLVYRGKGSPADGRVFAQIVDVRRKLVVGNQVTPIPVRLDGRRHTVSRPLDPIAASARKSGRYTLQIISSSRVWTPQRGSGTVHVSRARLVLPTAR